MRLRLHFGTDIAACEELCREVNKQFGGDRRFRVSMQRITDLGGENTGKFATMPAEDAAKAVWHFAGLLPDLQVDDLDPKANVICYAARPNNMLIRTDGQIGRCVAHLNDPVTNVGRISPDGYVEIDRQRLQPWFKGFDTIDSKMLACPYVAVPDEMWPPADLPSVFPVKFSGRRCTEKTN